VKSSQVKFILYALIAGGCVARVLAALHHNPVEAISGDSQRQWVFSQVPLRRDPQAGFDPILYPLWLWLVRMWTGYSFARLGWYTAALSVATPLVWYLFLRRALRHEIVALCGAVLLLWLPSWIGIYSYFLNETLLLPMLGLALWQTQRTIDTPGPPRLKPFRLSVVVWALACLTRAVALPAALTAMYYEFRDSKAPRRMLRQGSIIALLMLVPAGLRTVWILGVFAPFGYPMKDTIMFLSGTRRVEFTLVPPGDKTAHQYWYQPYSTRLEGNVAPLSDWRTSRVGVARFDIDLHRGSRDWLAALFGQARWSQLPRLYLDNWVILLFAPSYDDCNPHHLWEACAVWMRFLWAPLYLLVFVGNLLALRCGERPAFIMAVNVVTWVTCLLLPVAVMEGRYRKPLEGLLIANFMWLVDIWWTRRERPRVSEAGDTT
jgi:hypothetical protein